MASKEKQAVKNLNIENAQQENEREQGPVQNGEESLNSRGSESQKPGGNWNIPNRHIDHNQEGDGVEKFIQQMMEIKRKTKEQQMRHHKCFQTPEPDNHDFCLIP
ncbi:Hypothetical predicted protein [Lynx pardinus]|uniref:Uncharacterized protein n=1 Tax=Lynx pardinus TaxID=191816 RepID=A0A485PL60_LYNPA|nr:Hypothetical predicted protein [Lynx pardinus]